MNPHSYPLSCHKIHRAAIGHNMPFIHVAWLPKACRTPEIRKEVASAIIKAVTAVKGAEITPDKVIQNHRHKLHKF